MLSATALFGTDNTLYRSNRNSASVIRGWNQGQVPPPLQLTHSPTDLPYQFDYHSHCAAREQLSLDSDFFPVAVPPYIRQDPLFANMDQYHRDSHQNSPSLPQTDGEQQQQSGSPRRRRHRVDHPNPSFESIDHPTLVQRSDDLSSRSTRRFNGPSMAPFSGYAPMLTPPQVSYPPRGVPFHPHAYTYYHQHAHHPPLHYPYLQPRTSRYSDHAHMSSPEHAWSMAMGMPSPSLQQQSPPSLFLPSDTALLSSSEVKLILDVQPGDVLSGRGGSTNAYSGNRAFRAVVKMHQEMYLEAKKRDKPAVASKVVEQIRKGGGRFLKKLEKREYPPHLQLSGPVWVDIGDERAREKASQALREGAPEIRKRTKRRKKINRGAKIGSGDSAASSSFDEADDNDDDHDTSFDQERVSGNLGQNNAIDEQDHSVDDIQIMLSPKTMKQEREQNNPGEGPFTPGRLSVAGHGEDSEGIQMHRVRQSHSAARNDRYGTLNRDVASDDAVETSIVIRPWLRLIPDCTTVKPIQLHQLSNDDRDLYLRDFFPPYPENEQPPHRSSITPPSFEVCSSL